jgi:hypothetical protein
VAFPHRIDTSSSPRYEFFPYDYGPFSGAIYTDLEELISAQLVREVGTPGYTWSRYQVTGAERVPAKRLVREPPAPSTTPGGVASD